MWAYEVDGPGFVRRVERADDASPLEDGQVRLRFRAGGICGSDMPLLQGVPAASVSGAHAGAPIHEIVGEVVQSRSDRLLVGQRVVGTGGAVAGLTELLVESAHSFIPVPDGVDDVEAVPIQSVATVIRAADKLPDVRGRRVAVIGAGPVGLAFLHVLRDRGAAQLVSIDPVPRAEVARHYGADVFVPLHSSRWADTLDPSERPDIVVEAVGHQHASIRDALHAVADGGFVYGFGAPDDDEYVLPYRQVYERGLTLMSGRTIDGWVDVLDAGRDYLLTHRDDFRDYVSHAISVHDAQRAYSLYARPQPGRVKVALVDDTRSRTSR